MKRSQSKIIRTLLAFFLIQSTAFAATLYVSTGGNDANSGTSWAAAKKTVQAAINAANALDEIWVAAGTYNEHISNKAIGDVAVDMAIYGGFAGTEVLRSERNIDANLTVLHGTNNGIVVTIQYAAGRATRIDGFCITGGNKSTTPGDPGGGIHITASAPTIANNIIKGNLSYGIGAGISIWGFRTRPDLEAEYPPLIINNKIVDNFIYEFAGDGGGIGIVGSSPEIRNNVIARNQANQNGGGICIWRNSAPVIDNNFIMANASNILDGGSNMNYGGGGIYASSYNENGTPCEVCISAPKIFNNVIAANGALKGGGIAIASSNYGVAEITNNTVANNSGAGIHWATAAPLIRNNLVVGNTWGMEQWNIGTNSPVIAYNNVFGNTLQGFSTNYEGISDATGTSGNISADPKLANTRIGDYHIQQDSPCVNAGSSAAAGSDWTDIDEQARITGAAVDIGADESDGTTWNVATPVIRVKTDGDDANDGSSWGAAKQTLTAGIQAAASTGGEVWVKAGTYLERITVPAFVHLYGGFAGTETQRSGRSISANPTIIDGNYVPPVVSFTQAGYLDSTLEGFFVQHGGFYTAGSYPTDQSKLKEGRGGGLFIRTSGPVVENNTIRWNSLGNPFATPATFTQGAGICVQSCFNGRILNNVLVNNNAAGSTISIGMGAGIYCEVTKTPTGDHLDDVLIINNTFVNNIAIDAVYNQGGWGGGIAIALLEERMVIANNIVAFNSSGIWQAAGLSIYPEFIKNDFYQNPAAPPNDYSYVNLSADPTDISVNPLFVNKAGGDFRLQPTSPCIDNGDGTIAGLPTTDIDGNTRPKDGNYDGIAKIDIGAYEFSQCVGGPSGAGRRRGRHGPGAVEDRPQGHQPAGVCLLLRPGRLPIEIMAALWRP